MISANTIMRHCEDRYDRHEPDDDETEDQAREAEELQAEALRRMRD